MREIIIISGGFFVDVVVCVVRECERDYYY